MGNLREHQHAPHRLDGGISMNGFADGIADALLQIMQEGVHAVVAQFFISHRLRGISTWR